MTHVSPLPGPPRVPPVDPELLSSAAFLFGEYLAQLAAEALPPDEDAPEEDGEAGLPIDTRAVLGLFTDELGTSVQLTLTLYMRVTALFRLLAGSPSLARMAMADEESGDQLSEDALVAAARLDLHVTRDGEDGSADFDPREFREALHTG